MIHILYIPSFYYIPRLSLKTTWNNYCNPVQPSHISSLFFHQLCGKAQRLDSYVTQWALTCWNRKYMGSTDEFARWYSEYIRYYEEGDELCILFSLGHCTNDLNMNWTWLEWLGLVMSFMLGSHFSKTPFFLQIFSSDLLDWSKKLIRFHLIKNPLPGLGWNCSWPQPQKKGCTPWNRAQLKEIYFHLVVCIFILFFRRTSWKSSKRSWKRSYVAFSVGTFFKFYWKTPRWIAGTGLLATYIDMRIRVYSVYIKENIKNICIQFDTLNIYHILILYYYQWFKHHQLYKQNKEHRPYQTSNHSPWESMGPDRQVEGNRAR